MFFPLLLNLKYILYNNLFGEIIWIGIDDTDSTTGGCTTFVAKTIIEKLSRDYEIIGYPNLVRLNPNIPWKTRGNGAVSIQLDFRKKDKKIKDKLKIIEILRTTIDDLSINDKNTNPGFVITQLKPPVDFYKKAVTSVIDIKETIDYLDSINADYFGYKNKRGLIGALASICWKPTKNKSFELIAYREKKRWGTKRYLDDKSVIEMDKKIQSTFDNYDYINKHNRIVPNSPCPILFGIRGENPEDLKKASEIIGSESVEGWLTFQTNQGTDDHLQKKKIVDIQPYESVIVNGVVDNKPKTIRGGHVFFEISDNTGNIDCAAYEPTKEFRDIVRELTICDKVTVYGGVRKKPLTVNIEKIKINNLVKIEEKIENPICPKCNKHMKSKGKNQGFKCIRCGEKSNNPSFIIVNRKIKNKFYEVPICARRHLSMPLKRLSKN